MRTGLPMMRTNRQWIGTEQSGCADHATSSRHKSTQTDADSTPRPLHDHTSSRAAPVSPHTIPNYNKRPYSALLSGSPPPHHPPCVCALSPHARKVRFVPEAIESGSERMGKYRMPMTIRQKDLYLHIVRIAETHEAIEDLLCR